MSRTTARTLFGALALAAVAASPGLAGNALREKNKPAAIAGSPLTVTPARDWNRLGVSPGKKTELWTLDGEVLNDAPSSQASNRASRWSER